MPENKKNQRVLLFDLDETLLNNNKTISKVTLDALKECREKGYLIGISTSRGEMNSIHLVSELSPDFMICSGGAVIKGREEYLYVAEFTEKETSQIIAFVREVCGQECKMTIDTLDSHYWSFCENPDEIVANWGNVEFVDFSNLHVKALKFCVEIADPQLAEQLAENMHDCDCIKFWGSDWYKFTKKEATKEHAIEIFGEKTGISLNQITAFGDDLPDIGMLKLCGTGIAMGNALDEVKREADFVIGTNDEDGIAEYLRTYCLNTDD